MKKLVDTFKKLDTYRYILSLILILESIYRTIIFTNAPSNVEQAEAFRPLCICMGILILINMDIKMWANLCSLIYVPVCYIATHFAYEKHWIFDVNKYQYPGIIRLGKVIILLWGIIAISIIRHVIKNKSWKKIKEYRLSIIIPLTLFFLCILLFMRNYTELLFLIFEIVGLTFVMANPERRTLIIKALVDAFILSFVYVMAQSLRYRPYDCERYDLTFSNSNMAGAYLAAVVICIFVKIEAIWKKDVTKKWKKIVGLIVAYIVLGIAIAVSLFNYTRTTLAALGFAFIVALVLSLLKTKKKKGIWGRFGFVILATVMLFNVTFLALRYIPAYFAAYKSQPILYIGENDPVVKVQFGDSINSPKYTTMNSYLRMVFGKWGILIKFDGEKESEKQSESVVFDGRDVTAGRIEIWGMYIDKLNATGHYPFHIYDKDGNIIGHSHNAYLMYAYQLGVPAGIIHIIFTLMLFAGAVAIYRKKEDEDGSLFYALLVISVCMIGQISEWVSRPQYSLYFAFVFGLAVILNVKKDKKEEVIDEDKE